MSIQDQTHIDSQSENFLRLLEEEQKLRLNQVPNVKTVLVILSSRGMVYDMESLRQKIMLTYPEAKVFYRSTLGFTIAAPAPESVDLLIDLTGPRQKQGWFYSKKLRRQARVAVGRNAGFFRVGSYDRIFNEKDPAQKVPTELLERERFVQRKVLEMVGIPMAQVGDTPQDRGKTIALELPPMEKL